MTQAFASSIITMPQIKIIIESENKPANLPTPEEIIQQCRIERPAQVTETNKFGVKLPLGEGKYYWVKFGRSITMGEAKTQDYVARVFDARPDDTVRAPWVYLAFQWGQICYIVMEYINGKTCENSDADLVATAVQSLIDIKSPTSDSEPGPVGGGPIQHPFFIDWSASRRYESYKELEKHINGVSVPLGLSPYLYSSCTLDDS